MLYLRHVVPEIRQVESVRIINTTGDAVVADDFAERVRFWGPEIVSVLSDGFEGPHDPADLAFVLHHKGLYSRDMFLVRMVRVALAFARVVVAYDVRMERAFRVDGDSFQSFRWRAVVLPLVLSIIRRLPKPIRRFLL